MVLGLRVYSPHPFLKLPGVSWLFSEVGANSSESSFQGGEIIGKGDKSEAGAVGEANWKQNVCLGCFPKDHSI